MEGDPGCRQVFWFNAGLREAWPPAGIRSDESRLVLNKGPDNARIDAVFDCGFLRSHLLRCGLSAGDKGPLESCADDGLSDPPA
jgi:hypothetical protein